MCHDPKTIANRHFVVLPYSPDNNDRMVVTELPTICPCSRGEKCRIFFDHLRDRKTGPGFPLCVVRCQTHGTGFTLYPPGFTPWGRKPWVPVAPDGHIIRKNNTQFFLNTYFEGALDAVNNLFWTREKDTEPDGKESLYTQQCHLNRAARILGFGQNSIEAFTQTLRISGQQFYEAISAVNLTRDPKSYMINLGSFVTDVLNIIASDSESLFERLAACGAAVGLWPPLHVWRTDLKQLLPKPFYHAGKDPKRAVP